MSKILKRRKISEEILSIIKSAKDELIIVSPYIKLTPEIKQAFRDQEDKVLINLVFFREKIHKYVFDFFDNMPNVFLYANSYLHTKCYMNEKKALLTSMNLYEYSMRNNFELGSLFKNKGLDKRNYEEIRNEMFFIMERSHCISDYKTRAYENDGKTGYCTSCKKAIHQQKTIIQTENPMDWRKEWVCDKCYEELNSIDIQKDFSTFMSKFGNFCYNCGSDDVLTIFPGFIPICSKCMGKDLSPIKN